MWCCSIIHWIHESATFAVLGVMLVAASCSSSAVDATALGVGASLPGNDIIDQRSIPVLTKESNMLSEHEAAPINAANYHLEHADSKNNISVQLAQQPHRQQQQLVDHDFRQPKNFEEFQKSKACINYLHRIKKNHVQERQPISEPLSELLRSESRFEIKSDQKDTSGDLLASLGNQHNISGDEHIDLFASYVDSSPEVFSSVHEMMYNTLWGGVVAQVNSTVLLYPYIWKANSENIIASLDMLKHASSRVHSRGTASSTHQLDFIEQLSHRNGTNRQVFTFVRNPLDHWISGVAEAHCRQHVPLCRRYDAFNASDPNVINALQEARFAEQMLSPLFVRRIIEAIVIGDAAFMEEQFWMPHHMALMSHTVNYWQPTFLGYVESFESDWTTMQKQFDLNIPLVNGRQHLTRYLHGMKDAINEVFASDPAYLRAVCRLLAVDYVCLRYRIPTECADMITDSGDYVPFV